MKEVIGYKPECCPLCREYIFDNAKEALKHESECDRNEANKTCFTCRYHKQVEGPISIRTNCMEWRYVIERTDKPAWNCKWWKRYIDIPKEVEKEIQEKTKGNMWLVGDLERKYYEEVDKKEREAERK